MTSQASETIRPVVPAIRGYVREPGFRRVSHGLYLHASALRDPYAVLGAWSAVLPRNAAFTSLTAAELRGWWQSAEVDHPVFAAVTQTEPCAHRPGLMVSRLVGQVPVETVNGVRVTSAGETLLAAARDLSLLDLVVLGDSALHLKHCRLVDIEQAAEQRRWGARRLRQVVPLLDGRSESAWESILRMLHRAAEVPVETQHDVRDAFGRTVAYGDLWVVGTRRLNEYDGEGHRNKDQYRDDQRRQRALVDLEWQRVGFVAGQLLHEAGDIIAGLDRLLGRRWDPRRLKRWEAMLDASLLRSAGQARALARWSPATR